jgi:nucleotide-binding universal stress UspA family protein
VVVQARGPHLAEAAAKLAEALGVKVSVFTARDILEISFKNGEPRSDAEDLVVGTAHRLGLSLEIL